jgi:ABC-2 type transport system permease protein
MSKLKKTLFTRTGWVFPVTIASVILILVALAFSAAGGRLKWVGLALGAIAVVAIGLGLYVQRDAWKQLATARSFRYGANAILLTAAVVAIVLFVNILGAQYRARWDLTANKRLTLSQQTVTLLRELDQPIKAYAFMQPGTYETTQVSKLLQEYALISDKFKYEVVDTNKNPALTQRFSIDMMNMVVFETAAQTRKVYAWDIFTQSQTSQATEFTGEQAFTRAIRDVTQGKAGMIYFMTAHGERNLNMDFRQVRAFLEGEGYDVEELNIAEKAGVPDDAALVVLPGPQKDYSKAEVDALDLYARGGGRLMVMLDPPTRGEPLPQLEKWLSSWGVKARRDIAVDPERNYFLDSRSPIPQWDYHATTRDLMKERVQTVVPRSRSLAKGDVPVGYQATGLMKTSDASWGEVDLTAQRPSKDSKDTEGPLWLGYVIEAEYREESEEEEQQERDPTARILVMGSSSWLTSDVLRFQGNLDFFLNSVNWLSGREEMLTIRPKSPEYRLVQLTGASATVIFFVTVILMPLAVLLMGGAVWWRRRSL